MELVPWAEIVCRCFDLPHEVAEIGRRALDTPAAGRYLARLDGEPVGTTLLYSAHGMGYIDLVGTLPEFRRRGVASALVARAAADSAGLGHRWTALEVARDSGAERLYGRLGFRRQHERPRYVRRYRPQ